MKYKARVGKILDNLENQTGNLLKALDKGTLNEREVYEAVKSISKNVDNVQNLVALEENDFDANQAPAPGSVEAPTPEKQPRREKRDHQTSRVEEDDLEEARTERVKTDGGHSKKKGNTERVEFD